MTKQEKIKKIQRLLIEQGYDKVEVNGQLDEATKAAIYPYSKIALPKKLERILYSHPGILDRPGEADRIRSSIRSSTAFVGKDELNFFINFLEKKLEQKPQAKD